MNKELIRKALNEGALRHTILRDLAVSTKVVAISGHQGEVLAHYADRVVFGWDAGKVNSFNYEEPHQIYLAPLCFVEDKPVYMGDTLYRQSGGRVTVRGLNTNGTTLSSRRKTPGCCSPAITSWRGPPPSLRRPTARWGPIWPALKR